MRGRTWVKHRVSRPAQPLSSYHIDALASRLSPDTKDICRDKSTTQGVGFERKFNANGVEWEEGQYPKTKFVPQQEKYDPTSIKGTQAQDDLPPQDHKQKDKYKLLEEIDAFKEAPKALVKWVPKTTSSSTSSSTTTTPRIPVKMMWIPKKKN